MTGGLSIREIDALSCTNCGASHSWRQEGHRRHRIASAVIVARCIRCGQRVFAKKLREVDKEPAPSRALQEYSVACKFYRAAVEGSGAVVPPPLGHTDSIVAFEFMVGRTLEDVIRHGRRGEQRAHIYEGGQWFANFHRAGLQAHGAGDFEARLEAIAGRVNASSNRSPVVHDALAFLGRATQQLCDRKLRLVTLHGDAKPANLLVLEANSQICGFDIDGRYINAAEMDVAQFVVQIHIAASSPFGMPDDELARDLERHFLNGYRQNGGYEQEVVRWMKVYFGLGFWVSARGRNILQRRLLDHVLEGITQEAVALESGTDAMGATPSATGLAHGAIESPYQRH
jgi:hypothetical protein